MANKPLFKPSDLDKQVDFTTIQTVISPVNGSSSKKPVTLFTKWGAIRRRNLTQQYAVIGTTIEDSIVIGVAHDSRINKSMGVTLAGVNYQILDVSPDESNNYLTYDLITIKKVAK